MYARLGNYFIIVSSHSGTNKLQCSNKSYCDHITLWMSTFSIFMVSSSSRPVTLIFIWKDLLYNSNSDFNGTLVRLLCHPMSLIVVHSHANMMTCNINFITTSHEEKIGFPKCFKSGKICSFKTSTGTELLYPAW